jgi:hypothetical protein
LESPVLYNIVGGVFDLHYSFVSVSLLWWSKSYEKGCNSKECKSRLCATINGCPYFTCIVVVVDYVVVVVWKTVNKFVINIQVIITNLAIPNCNRNFDA